MIENYSLAFIHAQLLANPSTEEVAAELNVTPSVLQEHLSLFEYKGEPITVEFLKNQDLKDFMDACDTGYSRALNRGYKISYSLKQIHALILANLSEKEVAKALGIIPYTLTNQIVCFSYKDQYLTFKQLQDLTIEDAQNEWGDNYNQPLENTKICLSNIPFSTIYSHIRKSQCRTQAAISLGVDEGVFVRFLTKSKLDYDTLKKSSKAILKIEMGANYYKPLKGNPIKISTYSLAQIHQRVCTTKKLTTTANSFGVHQNTLKKYLLKIPYNNGGLTFDDLRDLSISQAQFIWNENYNKPLKDLYTNKRKREELGEDHEKQTAPAFPKPVGNAYLVKYAAGGLGFFREETQTRDSVLISTSCAAL